MSFSDNNLPNFYRTLSPEEIQLNNEQVKLASLLLVHLNFKYPQDQGAYLIDWNKNREFYEKHKKQIQKYFPIGFEAKTDKEIFDHFRKIFLDVFDLILKTKQVGRGLTCYLISGTDDALILLNGKLQFAPRGVPTIGY